MYCQSPCFYSLFITVSKLLYFDLTTLQCSEYLINIQYPLKASSYSTVKHTVQLLTKFDIKGFFDQLFLNDIEIKFLLGIFLENLYYLLIFKIKMKDIWSRLTIMGIHNEV
jgi:hypothetical protein